MSRVFKKCIFLFGFLSIHVSYFACDDATVNLVSETDNGNGTFTYVITLCNEMLGLESIPDQFRFTFSGGTVSAINSVSPNTVSTSGGDVYTKSIAGLVVNYNMGSIFPVHNSSLFCNTYTLTVTGRPSNIAVNTNSSYSPSCNHNIAIPATPPCSVTAAISGTAAICSGSSTSLNIDFTGTGPWTVTYTDGTTPTTVSGINASPYVFSVSPGSTKSYTISSVNNSSCAGTFSGTATVTVTTASAPTYTKTSTNVTCAGATTGTISINPTSANTTFDWVSGPITSPIPAGNLPGGATDERALANLPIGTYCVDITRTSSSTINSSIFTETFEGGAANWTLDNSNGTNVWDINNSFAGGTCAGIGSVSATVNQPGAITGSPQSSYLHIRATSTSPVTCGPGSVNFPPLSANFNGSQASNQTATLNTGINTSGMSNVVFSFYWLGDGDNNDFAILEYSLDGGSVWTQAGAKLNNQTTWIQSTRTDPSWSNQADLRFRFTWINNSSSSQDPPIAIDQIVITADVPSNCTNTVQECFTITAPANITPTFAALSPDCQDAAPVALPTTSTNGITGTWNPAVSTATSGNHTYTFTPDPGQCAVNTTLTQFINPLLTPVITCGTLTTSSVEFNWSALAGATIYSITYSINGIGLISGGGVVGTSYSITGLNPGDVVDISVSPGGTGCYLIGTGQCTAMDCTPPVISAQPPANQTLCEGLPVLYSVTVSGGSAFQWQVSMDNGSTFSNLANAGVYSGVTTTDLAVSDNTGLDGAIYQLVVTGADPACPALSNPASTLTVTPKVTPNFTAIASICENGVAPALPNLSTNGVNGSWNPAAIAVSPSGTTTYTFTENAGECAVGTTMDITIDPNLMPVVVCGVSTVSSVNFDWQTIAGATSYDLTYTVNGGGATSLNVVASSYTVTGLSPLDVVDLTVTPLGTGCFVSGIGSCNAAACTAPVINSQASNDVNCQGVSVNLTLGVTGGTSYQWQVSSDGGLTYSNLSNNAIYSGVDFTTLIISDNSGLNGNLYQLIVNEVSNTCPVTSNPVSLTVNPITSPLISCGVLSSNSVQFNWTALAGATDYDISYSVNGGALQSGGTVLTNTFTVSGLSVNDVVDISVSPNGSGCYTSGTGSCMAINCTAPTISTQPLDNSSCEGTVVNLSIVENGGTSYQWQISTDGGTTFTDLADGGVYTGSTTTALSISDNTGLNGNQYRVVVNEVNNSCPTTSNVASLTVTAFETPAITCGVTALTSVSFDWLALTGATDYDITYAVNSGAVQSGGNQVGVGFTLNGLSPGDVVDVTVSANGTGCYLAGTGSCTANACTAPTISAQPVNNSSCEGTAVNLSVTENGGTSYQWQISTDGGATFTDLANGGVYGGATTANLSISDNTGLNGNQYHLVIHEINNFCPTTSNAVSLTVTSYQTPVISCGVSTVSSVVFNWLGLTGATSYDISYTVNSGALQNIGNQAGTGFVLTGLTPGDVVDITVSTNGTGCYLDGTGTCSALNCTAPTITAQPSSVSLCEGTSCTFTVGQIGGSGIQWQVSVDGGTTFNNVVNAAVFSGATSNTLAISDNTGLDGLIFRAIVSEVNAACPSTSNQATLDVKPVPVIVASNNGPLCEGTQLDLTVTTIAGATYVWTGPAFASPTQNPSILLTTPANAGNYSVTATLNGCTGTASTNVVINSPAVVTINPAGPLCQNDFPISLTADIPGGVWSGNGITDTNLGIFDPGAAAVGANAITYTLLAGCGGSASSTVVVNAIPTASFTVLTSELDPINPQVMTSNFSQNAASFLWTFGDNSSSTADEPSHLYSFDVQNYTVTLVATSVEGCMDTSSLLVSVPETLIFYVPNAFTPNGDELNNVFEPVFTSGYDPFDYELLIFNRWGERIFESHDVLVGWDGTYAELGLVKSDVYTWKITFGLSSNADRILKVGTVEVLR